MRTFPLVLLLLPFFDSRTPILSFPTLNAETLLESFTPSVLAGHMRVSASYSVFSASPIQMAVVRLPSPYCISQFSKSPLIKYMHSIGSVFLREP